MKKAFYFLLIISILSSCNQTKNNVNEAETIEEHISFMSVPLDGSATEFIKNIRENSTNSKGCFSDNLEFQVDSVNLEKETFFCSWQDKESMNEFLWMDFEVWWTDITNRVGYIEGKSLMSWNLLRIFKTCLYESLGEATYLGAKISDKEKENWDIVEHKLFDSMSKNFCAWKLPNGYVVIDHEDPNKTDGRVLVIMYVVDNKNYCEYL